MKKYKVSVPFHAYERDIGNNQSITFTNLKNARKFFNQVKKVNSLQDVGQSYSDSEKQLIEKTYEAFGLYHDGFFDGNPVLTEVIENVIN